MEAVAKIPIFPVFVLFIAGFIPGSIPIIIKLGKFCLKCFIIIEVAVLQATTRASILYFSSKYLVILSHLAISPLCFYLHMEHIKYQQHRIYLHLLRFLLLHLIQLNRQDQNQKVLLSNISLLKFWQNYSQKNITKMLNKLI